MSGRILLIIIAGISLGLDAGNYPGYLAHIGPGSVRFLKPVQTLAVPAIDYLYITNVVEVAKATSSTNTPAQNIQANTNLQTIITNNNDTGVQTGIQPTNAIAQTNQSPQIVVDTNIISSAQVPVTTNVPEQFITPQLFVNFFRAQQSAVTSNKADRAIIVPTFMPPIPPSQPASSTATYNVK